MELAVLSAFAVFVVVLWGVSMRMLFVEIRNAVGQIETQEHNLDFGDDLKQQLYDLLTMAIDDSIGQLQPPSAFDHAVGAFSAFMQKKLTSPIPPNLYEGVTELAQEHGSTPEEKNNP